MRKVLGLPDDKLGANTAPTATPRASTENAAPQVQVLSVANENTNPADRPSAPANSADLVAPPVTREPRRVASVTQETQTIERPVLPPTSSGSPKKWVGLGGVAVLAVALWFGTRGSSSDFTGGVKKLPAPKTETVSRPRPQPRPTTPSTSNSSSSPSIVRRASPRKSPRSLRMPEAQDRSFDAGMPGVAEPAPSPAPASDAPSDPPPFPSPEEVNVASEPAAPPPIPPAPPVHDMQIEPPPAETQGLPPPVEQ